MARPDIELYESVALMRSMLVAREDGKGTIALPEGRRGAVVMVYGDHDAYEVEFMEGARTVALVTLYPRDVHRVDDVERREGKL